MKLRTKLDKILMEYIRLFEKKHDQEFEFAVVDDLAGMISFGSVYYFSISDIIYDIDKDLEPGLIFKWLEDCLENHHNHPPINLHSYANGLRFEDFE